MASPTIANRTIWTGDHLDHRQLLCGTCNSLTSDRDQTYLMAQVRVRVNKGLTAGAWDETLGAHGATREIHMDTSMRLEQYRDHLIHTRELGERIQRVRRSYSLLTSALCQGSPQIIYVGIQGGALHVPTSLSQHDLQHIDLQRVLFTDETGAEIQGVSIPVEDLDIRILADLISQWNQRMVAKEQLARGLEESGFALFVANDPENPGASMSVS